jgi:hypothetical protein
MREFDALVKAHQEVDRMEDYRAAMLPTLYANAHRSPNQRAFTPGDFFPSLVQTVAPQANLTQMRGLLGMLAAAGLAKKQ